MKLLWIYFFVAGGAFFLTGCKRRFAIAHFMLDVPNSRSSHTVPTPRGGGVAIAIAFSVGLCFCGGWE